MKVRYEGLLNNNDFYTKKEFLKLYGDSYKDEIENSLLIIDENKFNYYIGDKLRLVQDILNNTGLTFYMLDTLPLPIKVKFMNSSRIETLEITLRELKKLVHQIDSSLVKDPSIIPYIDNMVEDNTKHNNISSLENDVIKYMPEEYSILEKTMHIYLRLWSLYNNSVTNEQFVAIYSMLLENMGLKVFPKFEGTFAKVSYYVGEYNVMLELPSEFEHTQDGLSYLNSINAGISKTKFDEKLYQVYTNLINAKQSKQTYKSAYGQYVSNHQEKIQSNGEENLFFIELESVLKSGINPESTKYEDTMLKKYGVKISLANQKINGKYVPVRLLTIKGKIFIEQNSKWDLLSSNKLYEMINNGELVYTKESITSTPNKGGETHVR